MLGASDEAVFSLRNMVLAILLMGIVALGVSASTDDEGYSCKDCNVIIISIDLLRPDHMGAYGYERNTTPNIDRFAENATVFSNVYAQESYTLQSLMSTFTGLYPSQHGVTTLNATKRGFSNDFIMIPEVLNKSGYRTYGLFDPSDVRGEYGFSRGFDRHDSIYGFNNDTITLKRYLNRAGDQPFFLYYQDFKLHTPIFPPKNYSELFSGTNETFRNKSIAYWESLEKYPPEERFNKWQNWYHYTKLKNNPELVKHLESEYDGEVRRIDENIGRILDLVERKGLMNETIIIITANHGTEFGEHGGFREGTLHREGINVPFIVYLPHKDQNGEIKNHYLELINLGPTLLEALEIESERFETQSQGVSILPLLDDGEIQKSYVLAEKVTGHMIFIDRRTKLKLFKRPGGRLKVYNLTKDPWEQNPIEDKDKMRYIRQLFVEKYSEITGRNPFDVKTDKIYPYFAKE